MPSNIPFWVVVASILISTISTNGLAIYIQNRTANKNAEKLRKQQAEAATAAAEKVAEAAVAVDQVRKKLADSDSITVTKLGEIHELVNSRLSEQTKYGKEMLEYSKKLEVLVLSLTKAMGAVQMPPLPEPPR